MNEYKPVVVKCDHCNYWSPEKRPCASCGATLPERDPAIDFQESVIVPCAYCFQWGAVFMECKSCGAPIDPLKYFLPTAKYQDEYFASSSPYFIDGGVGPSMPYNADWQLDN